MEISLEMMEDLFSRSPELAFLKPDIEQALSLMSGSFMRGGTLLVCGNGGSAADAEHIVGELMKGFLKKRPLQPGDIEKLESSAGNAGRKIGEQLQGALPVLSLTSHASLRSAIANDTGNDMEYAQQVYGYGKEGDILLGISTSGNAGNVVKAALTARAFGIATVGLTGETGGKLAGICDCVIKAPSDHVPRIQEYHIQIYHALCAIIEANFFST